MKGCVILFTLSVLLPVCPTGKSPSFSRGQPSSSLLGPGMHKNLTIDPAKSSEVSPEDNFKDSITRKRWLGMDTTKGSFLTLLACPTLPNRGGGEIKKICGNKIAASSSLLLHSGLPKIKGEATPPPFLRGCIVCVAREEGGREG